MCDGLVKDGGIFKEVSVSFLGLALQEVAEQPGPPTLDTFRRDLDARWIEEALQASGTASLRKRRLPAEQVVWLVLGMALVRDKPIAEVVSRLDLALPGRGGSAIVAPSSVAQARQRLGSEPMEWLFNTSAETWAHESARGDEWRGFSLYAIDGTTLQSGKALVGRLREQSATATRVRKVASGVTTG